MAPIRSLRIELEPGSEPVAGRVVEDGGPGRAFVGYLELMSLLETVRAPARAEPAAAPEAHALATEEDS